MQSIAAKPQDTTLAATSPSSPAQADKGVIRRAEKYLENTAPVTEITRLLPPDVCDAVLGALCAETPEIGPERAPKAVGLLLAGYPQAVLRKRNSDEIFDMEAYSRTLARTVAKFPEFAVMGMIDRKPWGHPHLPSEPEIRAAMQDEVCRRAGIIFNAKAHKREHERREKKRAEDARIAAGRGATEDDRRLQVSAILAKFNRMDGKASA